MRLRFTFRTFLIFVIAAGCLLGWRLALVQRNRKAVTVLVDKGAILYSGFTESSSVLLADRRTLVPDDAVARTFYNALFPQVVEEVDLYHLHGSFEDSTFAALTNLDTVRKLHIGRTGIDDTGATELLNKRLLVLDLCDCPISDELLSNLDACPELRELMLSGSRVTDAGIKHIVQLPLRRLTLRSTRLTDNGLADVAKIVSLEVLFLDDTAVTNQGDGIGEFKTMAAAIVSFYGTIFGCLTLLVLAFIEYAKFRKQRDLEYRDEDASTADQ